MHMACPD